MKVSITTSNDEKSSSTVTTATHSSTYPSAVYYPKYTTTSKVLNNMANASSSSNAMNVSSYSINNKLRTGLHEFSLSRPSSARSFSSSISTGSTSSQAFVALKMERDLLERMVQERDEKIKTLQKTNDIQKNFIDGLQVKHDKEQERQKQEATRQKLYLQSITHEKNLIKAQFNVLQKENKKIKDDPIRIALISPPESPASKSSVKSGTNSQLFPDVDGSAIVDSKDDDSLDSLESETELVSSSPKIKILDGDQRCLVLQSQLYQAMSSLSSLQQQVTTMKNNYDEIVNSLQRELLEVEEAKTKIEVKLLSRMTVLEREKTIVEELLQSKIRAKDSRLRRLEKRVQKMDRIADDESLDEEDEEEVKKVSYAQHGEEDDSISGLNGDDDEGSETTKNVSNIQPRTDINNGRHQEVHELLSELEMLSAHSSSRRLFSNGIE